MPRVKAEPTVIAALCSGFGMTELECRSKKFTERFYAEVHLSIDGCRPERPGAGALYRKPAAKWGRRTGALRAHHR